MCKMWKIRIIAAIAICKPHYILVGGWTNPFEKSARQIGSFPQINRGENKQYFKPPPSIDRFGEDSGDFRLSPLVRAPIGFQAIFHTALQPGLSIRKFAVDGSGCNQFSKDLFFGGRMWGGNFGGHIVHNIPSYGGGSQPNKFQDPKLRVLTEMFALSKKAWWIPAHIWVTIVHKLPSLTSCHLSSCFEVVPSKFFSLENTHLGFSTQNQ